MNTIVRGVILLMFFPAFIACSDKGGHEMDSSKEQIKTIFNKMEKETNWYPEKNDMLWGYFFTDKSKEKLGALATKLQKEGYQLVEIRKDEVDDYYWLHLERIEKHSVNSLHVRNKTLDNFAKNNNINSYDGWDVGPLKK